MTNSELNEVYDTINILIKAGKWSILDDLLLYYGNAAWRMDVRLLMIWTTSTFSYRSKLNNREYFITQCSKFHLNIKE